MKYLMFLESLFQVEQAGKDESDGDELAAFHNCSSKTVRPTDCIIVT